MAAGPLLTEAGYRWRSVDGGAALVCNAAAALRPAVLLLSEVVGGDDGLGLLTRLRQDQPTADLPVLLVASPESALDEELALSLGATDCIAQPIKPLVLLARVALLYRSALHGRADPADPDPLLLGPPSVFGDPCPRCGGEAAASTPRGGRQR